nr:MAG TPA: hypothetical protein [Caudoviricetes sp.]
MCKKITPPVIDRRGKESQTKRKEIKKTSLSFDTTYYSTCGVTVSSSLLWL